MNGGSASFLRVHLGRLRVAWTSGGRGRGQTSKCPRQEEENAVLPKSSPMQGLVSLLGDPRSTARTLRGTSWERGPEGAAVTEAGGRAGRGRGPNGAGTAGGLGGAWEERSRPRPRRAHRRAHRPPPPTPPLPPRASRRPRHLAAGDPRPPRARLPDCGVGTGAAAAPAAHKAPDGAAAPRHPGSGSAERGLRVPASSCGAAPPSGSLEREGRPRDASTPAPCRAPARPRPSPPGNRRCRLGAEGSAWGVLTPGWAAPRRDLAGKDAWARAGERPRRRRRRLGREASTVRPWTCNRRARERAPPPPAAPPTGWPAPPSGPAHRPAPASPLAPASFPPPAPSPPLRPAGAVGSAENNAARRGNPSTKVSCDILLMAIIYSKSSLD